MSYFQLYKAIPFLQEKAAHPIDLKAVLSPERIANFSVKALGFQLLYGTERIDADILEGLLKLAAEANALQKMSDMQAGKRLNRIEGYLSENRTVLHTAMRDVFGDRQVSAASMAATKDAEKELRKLEEFLTHVEGKFTDVIQIGIGGSDLGPKALCLSMEPYYLPGRRVHFISNVDPDDAATVLSKVELKKTLIIVVSKSGTTLETLTNEAFVRERMEKEGISAKNHCVAVTGKDSPMDDPDKYLASFYIWDFVGGRYSATSMVGGVVLGFALGFSGFHEILRGAHDMDLHALNAEASQNLPLLSALLGIWNRNFLKMSTVAIIPYSQALHRFTAHLQQLDMESNGKRIDKSAEVVNFSTGPIVWGEPGTNGQHSFYQLIHQGTDVVPVEFIGFKECQHRDDLEIEGTTSQEKLLSNLFAQAIALAIGQESENPNQLFPGNRPSRILLARKLDPYTLGALLAFYEHKVAFQGFIWNINSFDQEGVQLGKKLANQVLDLFKQRRNKDSHDFKLGEAFLRFLEE